MMGFRVTKTNTVEEYLVKDKYNVDLDAMIVSGIDSLKDKSWSDVEMYCEAHFRRIVLDSETIIYGNEWIGK